MAEATQSVLGISTYSDISRYHDVSASTYPDTGDLRRKYDFSRLISALRIETDPFFRFLSKVSKVPTDDWKFKVAEERPMWHRRYAYVVGFHNGSADVFNDATLVTNGNKDMAAAAVGDTVVVYMATDYKNTGNIGNVIGNANNKVDVGDDNTYPIFFLPGQIVKIPLCDTSGGGNFGDFDDYVLIEVTEVSAINATKNNKKVTTLTGKIVRKPMSNTAKELVNYNSDSPVYTVYNKAITELEKGRCYVVGTAWGAGTGVPNTYADQPYSTTYGLTQIFKTAMAMDNSSRAVRLRFAADEWARLWGNKLIEHKWDIENTALFGSQYEDTSTGKRYTQGAVDYILRYGNVFSLDLTTKTIDDFLDDLSQFLDPRYGTDKPTVFFVSTQVYNWLNKIGGNSLFANTVTSNSAIRVDVSYAGRKSAFGVPMDVIRTPYGDIKVVRNIHLDGTNVKMLAINLKNVKYRPLVGNGLNRDTHVYVGVQTLENSGVDKRVDLILTEAGLEWTVGESHAVWL